MTGAAAVSHSPLWRDHVWLARHDGSRLYPVVRDFLQSADAAISAVSAETLNDFKSRSRLNLLKFRLKYALYVIWGDRAKKEKYRERIANEVRLLRGASVFLGFDRVERGRLTQIMDRCGSDKGSGGHNYALFYEVLFQDGRERIARVFEVGIGSNNIDVPSNMGKDGVPGASLRGWREYFPKADIFGGDIDSRILFQEDRIRTGYVDQTRPESVDQLFESFGGQFDVIIDDGLHRFEANRTFFDCAFKRLKDGGVHIIEDICRTEQESYKAFLSPYDAALLDIPYQPNQLDNCIAVVVKH